ncbi:MAG: hypothetical protein M1821_007840 [Bathelium mastoideum]|nr:MAG: hypothetical protein M1821_007840 [Bathelium mastoideum]
MPRIKSSGPKKALYAKREPGTEDDLKKDPNYNPKGERLSRCKSNGNRVKKRSQTAQTAAKQKRNSETPNAKHEPADANPSNASADRPTSGPRTRVRNPDEIEITLKDTAIIYEISLFTKRTEPLRDILALWRAKRPGISEARFFFEGERILDENANLKELGIDHLDVIEIFYEVLGGSGDWVLNEWDRWRELAWRNRGRSYMESPRTCQYF